ncbi:hypothetical protein SEA_CHERRYONLIM_53 [Gordonia phage CherryonLim]|uniref:Uncharacterized protein n=1 Tax=Gordonia phage CherryonLim TaxID=2652411 RepID=A0A5P8D9Y2_9CAUD|nr:hypothetical protein PP994_gp53 [Gordonia phage CherryonLim]QFP95806.1 hypothetical protein SEA_CHERRYONLIM_53 [Gordonia phage CherryonLim]
MLMYRYILWYQRPGENLWRHEDYHTKVMARMMARVLERRGLDTQVLQRSTDHE